MHTVSFAQGRGTVQPCSDAVSDGLIADLAYLDRLDSYLVNELARGIFLLQLSLLEYYINK
jgi:hypothetical protein